MSSKTVALLWWSLFAASVSAGPAVSSCALQKNTVLERSKLSGLNRLFGEVLTTQSNGNVYIVSICRPIPNTFYDPRKLVGAVKFTTEGQSIALGRIDQTDVVVNEHGILLTYVGGDIDANSKDTCRGRRWHTYVTFVCDPSAINDVLTLIDEDPDQPEICQVWFEIKTAKTCVRQPNVPFNVLENDLIKRNASIENGKNTEKWEKTKANQIPSGDESFRNEIGKFSVDKNAPKNKIEENDSNQNYSRSTISEYIPFVNRYLNVINENKSKDNDNKDENLNKTFETPEKSPDNGNRVDFRYTNAENTSFKNGTDSSVNENKLNTTFNNEIQTFNHRENNDFETLKKHSDDGNKEHFSDDITSKHENHNFGKEKESVNYENKNTAEGDSFNNANHYNGMNEYALNTTNILYRNGSQNTNAESKPLSNKNNNIDKEKIRTNYEINTNNSNTITAKDRSSSNNEINDFETNPKRSENGNEENSRNIIAKYKSSRNENDNFINETKPSNRENKERGSNTTTAEDHYGSKNENEENFRNTTAEYKSSRNENDNSINETKPSNRENKEHGSNTTTAEDHYGSKNENEDNSRNTTAEYKSSRNKNDNSINETKPSDRENKEHGSNTTTAEDHYGSENENATNAQNADSQDESSKNENDNRNKSVNDKNREDDNSNDNSTVKSDDSSDVEKSNRSDAENGKPSGNRSENKPTETGGKSAAGKNDTSSDVNKTDDSNRSARDPTTKNGNADGMTTTAAVVESSTNRLSDTTSGRTEIENPPFETAANGSSTTINDKSPSNKTKHVTPTTGRPGSESDPQVLSNTSSRPSNAVDDGTNNVPADVSSDANGTRLSASTILGGLGLFSVLCAVGGTAVNRYYYKLTGTDQIPFKGTFQSVYSRVKAFVTKTLCCCVGGPAAPDSVTDEKSSLLQPKYVPGEERTSRKDEKHRTSSDDNSKNGYGSMSNEKHSPTAGKKYRKKRSKSKSARVDSGDSGPDNVIPSKHLKTEDNSQGKSVKDVINEKMSAIMNTKIKPAIENIFGKTEKKFGNADREQKEENAETTPNEPSSVSQLMDGKSAKNDDDGGVRVDEKTGTDITEFPLKITEESEKQRLDANPNNGENVKSSSGFDVSEGQNDSENSKVKLINKLVDDLDSIRFELDAKPEKLLGAKKSIDSGGTKTEKTDKRETNKAAAVNDEPPSNISNTARATNAIETTALQGENGKKDEIPKESGDVKAEKPAAEFRFVGSGADEEEGHAQTRKERPAEESDAPEWESADNDDGSIEIIEEIVYVDAESGEDGEEIVVETTETVTVRESPDSSDAFGRESAESPSEKVSTTVARKTSSSAAPGEETGGTVLASTPGASVKKPFGFQLGIGKSGVNMSVGAKQLGIGRSGVKFGKRVEAEGDGRDAMTIKLDKSGLKLNRDKKNASRASDGTDGSDDAAGPGTRDATSARKKSKPNFTVFKRSVSQPIGSDVREADDDDDDDDDGSAASGVVSKKPPSRSSAGLLKFGRSRSKSAEVVDADDGFTTDADVLSSFIGHERYASSLSVDDVPDSEETAGRRGNAVSRSASSPDYASVPSVPSSSSSSSSFDRHVQPSVPSPKDDGDRRPTKAADNKSNIKSKLNRFKKHTLNR